MPIDAVTQVPTPAAEPGHGYPPGGPERERLERRLDELAAEVLPLPMTVGGEPRFGGGERTDVVQPHHHAAKLGVLGRATHQDARLAVDAALAAAAAWRALTFDDRAAVFLRAADLLAGPWRETLTAAAMLGQSMTAPQAERDAVCELADTWRFDVQAARLLLAGQPDSAPGTWTRTDHRPLDGFVYALGPFSSTAVAAALATGPALMGNTVVWKPATAQTYTAHFVLRLLAEAGLPPGVVNLVTGDGRVLSEVALASPALAGVHLAGTAATLRELWAAVGAAVGGHRRIPRIAGRTGGKDFLVAHPSADPETVAAALVRGAFAYQGQGAPALSRAYLPRALWQRIGPAFLAGVDELAVGDVADPTNAMGALIDAAAYARVRSAVERGGGRARPRRAARRAPPAPPPPHVGRHPQPRPGIHRA
ncbi:aldehyde dehydrogenase family protein, partial [Kitasatospora sp. NPDC059571]|uniref:aldehyde dehydrogenase family protein n=1 Tax=Kitasatospora sp. NPDC059571 TaxID=3346871 RepID=UPI0036768EBE